MSEAPKPNKENPWINLLVNIVFPSLILSKLSSDDYLGPTYAFVVALSLPFLYGAWDFISRKKHNFISILGFVSILLTGGLGLLEVGGFWFAVKEAAIPGLIGIAVIVSQRTSKPLIKTILMNEHVMDTERVNAALAEHDKVDQFAGLLNKTSWILAASFFLSSVLNFALAIYLLKSPPGTEQFNVELGKMTALSYPVIVIPSMVILGFGLWTLMRGIKKMTGLTLEEVFKAQQ